MKSVLLFSFFLVTSTAFGAVAVDVSTTTTGAAVSSINRSHTFTGSNGLLLAAVHLYNASVTDCDYDKAPLTYVGTASIAAVNVEVWQLKAPATGAHTLTCNFDGATTNVVLGITTFTGVNQLTPIGTAVTSATASIFTTIDVSGAIGGLVVDFVTVDTEVPLIGASQSSLYSDVSGFINAASSYETGTGTDTMSWSWPSGQYSSQIGFVINPAAAATQAVRRAIVFQ